MTSPTDPVKNAPDDPRLRQALQAACAARGLDSTGARLIHRYNNTIYLLPYEHAVARLTSRLVPASWANANQQLVEWLIAEHSVAATCPLPGIAPVIVAEDLTIGFWRYYPQPHAPAPTSRHLARVLRQLHAVTTPPVPLHQWAPLASLANTLNDPTTAANLPDNDRDWLLGQLAQTRAELDQLDWQLGHGVIHGDAWAGNLLWDVAAGPNQATLGDWDGVCVGPREVDLIPSWHAAIRYGRGPNWASTFADVYGYDLSRWPGFDALLRMRDLVQLTGPLRRAAAEPILADALRERFDAIRHGDRNAVWRAF